MRKNGIIEWNKSLLGQCLPSQVFPLSLLAYPKAQGHLNDPSVLLHSEFGLFPQVWLPVAHSSISERYRQRNSNIGDQMIQIRRALITRGLEIWPLQLYIFDLSYWQVMTPYSCFFSTGDCKCVQENRSHH